MEKKILYRFSKMDLRQFATFEENYGDGKDIAMNCAYQFAYSSENNIVRSVLSLKMSKNELPLIKAELDIYFGLHPESAAAMTDEEYVVLPANLLRQFASLCYGSMRGILYVKTQGTPLSDIILPPSNMQDIFTEPIRIRHG